MTSKKVDQLLLILGVLLIFISSYQLFLSRFQGAGSGLSLGTLASTQAVVKIKNTFALDWRDAYSGSVVSEQQLIYTDEDSAAEIKFLQGHQVSISENSLIRIASIGNSSGLNVEKGLIRARIEGNEPLVIDVNGSELKLTGKNADVQISLQGDVGEIGVLSGEVAVEKEGQLARIDKNTALKVEEDALTTQRISFNLTAPAASEVIYSLEPTQNVTFRWYPEKKATLTLARDPAFKQVTSFEAEGSLVQNLRAGSYYWKVSDAQGASLVGSFSIIHETAPEILRPKDGEIIRLAQREGEKSELFLQWKGKSADSYLVEWVDDQTHAQIVSSPGFMLPLTKSGPIQWRVKIASQERTLAPWSAWQNLQVELVEAPSIPTELKPEELELQSYTNEEQEVELSWQTQGAVELEVLSPAGQQSLSVLTSTSHLLKIKEPGLYRWRVRGRDEFERVSEWSEFKTFKLEDLSHEATGEGFQRIQLKKPDQSVTFNWQAESGTTTVFELSEGKEFTEVIIKKEVTADEVKVVVPKVGDFYWRSRQYRPDGTFEVSEPKKVIIEPAPAPGKPEKLPDLEVPLQWQETYQRPQKSFWDFLIAQAYADELKAVARIQLPLNEDAKKYVIRIFRDEAGQDLVLEKVLESNHFEWVDSRPGLYYWQYAIIDFWERQTPFSDLSTLHLKGAPPVYPEKPRLLQPIRAVEVESENLKFKWTHSQKNKKYRIEISQDKSFREILLQKQTKSSRASFKRPALKAGLHYWRIIAMNDSQKEVLSNTGRFVIQESKPPLERIIVADQKAGWLKKYGTRISLAWAPSMDTYEFEGEEDKGEIDGNALNSLEASAFYFTDNLILSADLLRQSGEVFEGEKYLFQRLLLSASWKRKVGNHLWGPGLSVGSASGFAYEVVDEEVTSSSVSGLVYGPQVQGFYSLSQMWELQGKVSYLLGEIPHLELSAQANRQMKNFFLLLGLGYSSRSYTDGEGAQSSTRLTIGLGKEF